MANTRALLPENDNEMKTPCSLRTMVTNHNIHHRGQLSVHLRLNDIPLLDIDVSTADSVR